MADQKKPENTTKAEESTKAPVGEQQENEQGQTPGNVGTEPWKSSDLALAEKAGISEGEVKALRDDAGLNQSAGHESDIHAWSLTEAGKAFAKGEKDRVQAAKDEAKAYDEATSKDGLTKAEAAYREAVKG